MSDIFETDVYCNGCHNKTSKGIEYREGYQLRLWKCENCNKIWYHPTDIQKYNDFNSLKVKSFRVKLRMVGNSYTVSIPREIIDFEREMRKEIDDFINMSLEEPEKLSLFFSKKMKEL